MKVSMQPSREARRARIAVGVLFLVNAVVFANVVPRFPEFKAELGLSNAALGLAIAAGPVGALIAGSITSPLIRRFGSARVAVVSSALMGANLLLIGSASSWVGLAAGLFLAGFADSVGDVSNNMHGLRVQRRYGRSIINTFHGVWSIGAVFGGLTGSVAAGLGVPIFAHLALVAVVFVVISIASYWFLLPGVDGSERAQEPPAIHSPSRHGRRGMVVGSIVTIGLLAAFAGMMEDSGASWGAVYLHGSLGSTPAIAGLAFVSLQSFQTVGRLLGDRFVNHFGERKVIVTGAIVASVAMTGALVFPTVLTTIFGFGLVGLGIATMIPAAMHAADNLPGLPEGFGLTAAALITRFGFLFAPPLVGWIADATSLRIALITVPVAALGVLVCSRVVRSRPKAT
ncbi:MAG: MFS transporter [Lacisediminihabitans sp.]